MEYVLLIGGLVILIISGEALVRGAVGIALKFNISTLVIGMTIVSFGTSVPELLVSLKAAIAGHSEIAIGNVVGSNIANIALVLGLTTIILPIKVKSSTVKIDWPIMMVSTILFYLFSLNENIEWYEGLIFTIGLIAFNLFMFGKFKKGNIKEDVDLDIEIDQNKPPKILFNLFLIAAGSIGLAFGTDWLLNGSIQIATDFGVSEHIIGVTIVAFGTSVPELITCIVASVKKQTDISVGNLIGSNIFNILGVLGITSLIKEIPVSLQVIHVDAFWLLAVSFIIFPLMIIGNKINRIRGLLLFVSYCIYIYFVVS